MLTRIPEKGNTYSLLVGVQTGAATMEISVVVPQDPATLFLCIFSKGSTSYYRDTCLSVFISALFIIARNW